MKSVLALLVISALVFYCQAAESTATTKASETVTGHESTTAPGQTTPHTTQKAADMKNSETKVEKPKLANSAVNLQSTLCLGFVPLAFAMRRLVA